MLSDTSRPVVQATLPVVGANIADIAERFYDHLFGEHPELLDGVFNRGNQAEGAQQQALAGSVASFATALLETPERVPEKLLSRIAHKHASLGISPEQYHVVHDNLMWAIVDVLGEAVTPEVAAAWDEVYWLMANALVNIERGLYSARGVRPQTVWRPWEVEQKIVETYDVVSFVVRRVDDRPVKTTASTDTSRSSGCRGNGKPAGEVSNLLHDAVDVGDVLTLSLPYGDVVLDDSGDPIVFVSAGIGITPMAGMLSHLVVAGSRLPIQLLHADLDERSFALRRQVRDDVAALPNTSMHVWYERGTDAAGSGGTSAGTMDLSGVDLRPDARYYLCGPLPFMQAVRGALLDRGVPPRAIQYEVFGPDLWQADLD